MISTRSNWNFQLSLFTLSSTLTNRWMKTWNCREVIFVYYMFFSLLWLQNCRHIKTIFSMTMSRYSHDTKWICKTIRVSSRNANNNFANVPRRITERPNHSYTLLAAQSMNPRHGNSKLVLSRRLSDKHMASFYNSVLNFFLIPFYILTP